MKSTNMYLFFWVAVALRHAGARNQKVTQMTQPNWAMRFMVTLELEGTVEELGPQQAVAGIEYHGRVQ